jgi:glycerol-3-phosphate cytidylyltransferase
MVKVLTYGTFDLFHYGHLRILQRAKSLGDYLVVAVSTDEFNKIKNKKSTYPYNERAEIVSIKAVDEVIPEDNWEQKIDDIKKHNIDIMVMGDDWKGKFDFLKDYCEVVYLERTPNISSPEIKEDIRGSK